VDSKFEPLRNRDSCGWLRKTVQQQGLSEKLFGCPQASGFHGHSRSSPNGLVHGSHRGSPGVFNNIRWFLT
jgi:hypothetical protein